MAPSFGLVGCGRWGSLILRDLASLGCEMHVVARSTESTTRAIEAGAAGIHNSVSALRASAAGLAGVLVATPTSTHAEVIGELLDAFECPVFTEKPMTCSKRDALRLLQRGRDRLFVMDKWRYHPAVERLRDAVASREFGSLLGLKTTRVQCGNPHPDIPGAWTYLPHDLAIVREIMGEIPDPRSARACPDGDALVAILGDRPWAVIEFSCRAWAKSRDITAHFDDATLCMADPLATNLIVVRQGTKRPESIDIGGEMPLLRELRAIVAFASGGAPPKSGVDEGYETVSVIEQLLAIGRVA